MQEVGSVQLVARIAAESPELILVSFAELRRKERAEIPAVR